MRSLATRFALVAARDCIVGGDAHRRGDIDNRPVPPGENPRVTGRGYCPACTSDLSLFQLVDRRAGIPPLSPFHPFLTLPLIFLLPPTRRWAMVAVGGMLLMCGALSFRSYVPSKHDPPYELYDRIAERVQTLLPQDQEKLIIADKTLAEYIVYATGIEAMSWLPEYEIDEYYIENNQSEQGKKILQQQPQFLSRPSDVILDSLFRNV